MGFVHFLNLKMGCNCLLYLEQIFLLNILSEVF